MRDGYYDVNWLSSLDSYGKKVMSEKLRNGSIDYPITLAQALKMRIRVRGKERTLRWIAENDPTRLETEMDVMDPGSVLFQAVTLVYNANLDKVLRVVWKENRRMRQAGIQGLRIQKNDQTLVRSTLRSSVHRALSTGRVNPISNGRPHLTKDSLKRLQ